MKIPGAIAMAVVTAATTYAAPSRVAVCSELGNGFAIARAESVAASIYKTIGVQIDWRRPTSCPQGAIQIDYSYHTDPFFMAGFEAYARPFEGIHILIFYDRIKQQSLPNEFPTVLGHVMAHEIGHILEGAERHSETGIMKAKMSPADFSAMAFHPLGFTEIDAKLIHQGLEARESRAPALR
jgi:hypothetical protein